MQKLGGNSGGGGNLRPANPISDDELTFFLEKQAPVLARWHLNLIGTDRGKDARWYAEDDNQHVELRQSLFQKVFLNQPRLHARLKTTKIQVQDKPCIDPVTGAERDASADAVANVVCFDRVGVRKSAPSFHLRSYVIALAVHEFTHLVGATEDEALYAESVAKDFIGMDGIALSNFTKLFALETLDEPRRALVALRDGFDRIPEEKLPSYLIYLGGLMATQFQWRLAITGQVGVSPYTTEQNINLLGLSMKGMSLIKLGRFLLNDNTAVDPVEVFPRQQRFDDGIPTEAGINQIFSHQFGRLVADSDITIRQLYRLGKSEWRRELNEMVELFGKIDEGESLPIYLPKERK